MRPWIVAVCLAVGLILPASAIAAAPSAFTDAARATTASQATLGGDVEPGGADTSYDFEYALSSDAFCTSSGATGAPNGTSPQTIPGSTTESPVAANVTGLTGGQSYCYRLVASNADGTTNGLFSTFVAGAPLASTADGSSTGAGTATITGAVNPASQMTSYRIDYDLQSSIWCQHDGASGSPAHSTTTVSLGFVDASDHDVSVDLSGLTPGGNYCAQLVADNASGTGLGGTVTFNSGDPNASSTGVLSTGASTASLSGSVFPLGQTTTYYAQYDLAGSTWCQSDGSVGAPANQTAPVTLPFADLNAHDVTIALSGLTAGSAYCVQLVAQNTSGIAQGGTVMFTAGAPLSNTTNGISTGATTARVTGMVNPAGQATTFHVDYAVISSAWCQSGGSSGSPTDHSPNQALIPIDATDHGVSVDLSGLISTDQYCAQLVASNASGSTDGGPVTFTAGLPVVHAFSASQTSPTSVTIDGSVDPTGQSTTVQANYDLASSTWCQSSGTSGSPGHSTGAQPLGGAADASDHPVSISVSGLTSGTAYCGELSATNATGTVTGGPVDFTPTQTPIVLEGAATAADAATEHLSGTVNPNGQSAIYTFQYDLNSSPWCASRGQSGSPGQFTTPQSAGSGSAAQDVSISIPGLAPGATYCWQISATNASGTVVTGTDTFRAGLPSATTGGATGVGMSVATLAGQINPEGNATTFSFAYDLAGSLWCTSGGASGSPSNETSSAPVGATDTVAHDVSRALSGLTAGATYCYQLSATNPAGTTAGAMQTFATTPPPAPAASTGVADGLSTSSATLHGWVNANGQATSYHFDYGATTAYGTSTPTQSAGSGSVAIAVQATLTGLLPNTTYHFRLLASSSGGPAIGSDNTFTTPPAVGATTRTLAVTIVGAGSVSSSPSGIGCPGACGHAFAPGTNVTLAAAAASGSHFSGWGGACSGSGTCAVTLSADETVTASFAKNPPPPPRCSLSAAGTKVSLTASHKKGKSSVKPGTLTFRVACDQAASVSVGGSLVVLGKKKGRGKPPSKTFGLGSVRGSVSAGGHTTLVIKLPSSALSALKQGGVGTAKLTMSARGATGTGHATATVGGIHAAQRG